MEKFWDNCKEKMNCAIQRNSKWQESSFLPKRTKILYTIWILKGIVIVAFISYFFYRSILAFFLLSPFIFMIAYDSRNQWERKSLHLIELGFKEWLLHIKSGLIAGNSIEQSILKSQLLMNKQFQDNAPILQGVDFICKSLICKENCEVLFYRYGEETNIKAIRDFSKIFAIAKRQGGSMVRILDKTMLIICERIETKQQVEMIVKAKQLEQNIMSLVPFFILLYVGQLNENYFLILYHNMLGILFMTICFILYIFSILWGKKIVQQRI